MLCLEGFAKRFAQEGLPKKALKKGLPNWLPNTVLHRKVCQRALPENVSQKVYPHSFPGSWIPHVCFAETWEVLVQCLQPPHQLQVADRTECPPFFLQRPREAWYSACTLPAVSSWFTGRNAHRFLQSQNVIFQFGDQLWPFFRQKLTIFEPWVPAWSPAAKNMPKG